MRLAPVLTRALFTLVACGAFAAVGPVACQTTDMTRRSFAAKATPTSCDRQSANSRRDCEDLPGCFWDNTHNRCTAQ